MERVLNAPVSVPKQFNRSNEHAFRQYVEGEAAMFYRKDQDIIIPYGCKLGFNGTGGQQVNFTYDGAFKITIDGVTVVELATDSALTTLESEVTAARDGEASLLAKITSVETVASDADTAAATAQSEITAARDGESSLLAKITSVESVAVSADGAASTVQSEVTAARQGEASLTAKVTALSNATSTVDGKLSASYALTVDANGRIASMKLLSNGTTSSVKFTASTFQVFNGTTDEAPFEVVGGVVKIKTANVGTLGASNISVSNLAAISANLGTITAGQVNLTSGSYVVRHGAGFGASSDLVLWYGLSSVAIGSATKTNGVFSLATDGKVYLAGTDLSVANFDASIGGASPNLDHSGTGLATTGTVTVDVVGGTPPYTYSWDAFIGSGVSISSTTSGSVTFSHNYTAVPEFCFTTWRCLVRDDDGRSVVLTVDVSGTSS